MRECSLAGFWLAAEVHLDSIERGDASLDQACIASNLIQLGLVRLFCDPANVVIFTISTRNSDKHYTVKLRQVGKSKSNLGINMCDAVFGYSEHLKSIALSQDWCKNSERLVGELVSYL